MDIEKIAPGLILDPAGYRLAPERIQPSYPADGNDLCLTVEEQSFWFAHRNRVITAAAQRHPPMDGPIFDVGAGNGFVAAALERAGFPTIAIEPSQAGAANAAARGLTEVVCGALPSNAFRPATAGGIGLFDVLEHIDDDRGYLRDIAPYLKPGGRLYLTVPAYQWLWSSNDVVSGHRRRYTIPTLRDVVSAAGFRVDYATYVFSLLPPAIFLARTLRSNLSSRERTPASSRAQHRAGGRALRWMAEKSLSFEIRRIKGGLAIPFGASCLLVGSFNPSAPGA